MSVDLDEIITEPGKCLGFSEIKDYQRSAVKAIVRGSDAFIAQPTGFGKSAIFQMVLFARAAISNLSSIRDLKNQKHYFTLVICPLNSLIRD